MKALVSVLSVAFCVCMLVACSSSKIEEQVPSVSSSSAALPEPAVSDKVVNVVQEPPELTDDIMGPSIISAESMAALYTDHGASYPADVYAQAGAATIEDFCRLCAEEAAAEGVRAEVLFAQAMHETAWLQFGNQVAVEQNNFGGLGAVNSGGAGEAFPDVRTGLRAQVQHLKAYASTDELVNECVDTRFELVQRGVAPQVPDLGGRWAWPGDGYGDALMAIVQDLYDLEYGKNNSNPASAGGQSDGSSSDAQFDGASASAQSSAPSADARESSEKAASSESE